MQTICCSSVLVCLLLLATGAAADPTPQACTSNDREVTHGVGTCIISDSKSTLPLQYCMPSPTANCGNSANKACKHCILFFEANDPTGTCKSSGGKYCSVLGGTTIQIATADAGAAKHWKVVPTLALKGVESMQNTPNTGDQLFQDGWHAAQKGQLPLPSGPTGLASAAMAINSAYTRRDHQMHIHIAPVDTSIFSKFNIKKPKWDDWVVLDGTQYKDKLMQCPTAGHKPKPFSALKDAITKNKWPITTGAGINPWDSTTVALIKPHFCTGGATCDFCYLMLYHVGDKDILNY